MKGWSREGWNRAVGTRIVPTFALTLSIFLTACEEAGPPEISPEEGAYVAEVGGAAVGALQRALVGRLTAAMEEGGEIRAVEFCSTEGLTLTDSVEAALGAELEVGLELKRSSFRYRNPLNAPDSAEEAALRYFEDAVLAGGEPPSLYVQRVSDTEMRYYQPLFMGEFCLRCHGDPDVMDPGVLEVLDEAYPTDLAKGYSAGDFRGVVRVSMPPVAGPS
jgi:hypothetical protein